MENREEEIVIRLEIGENLQKAMSDINETVRQENARHRIDSFMPGSQIQEAFGINFGKIIKELNKGIKKKKNRKTFREMLKELGGKLNIKIT